MRSILKIIIPSLFRRSATRPYPLKPRPEAPGYRGTLEIEIDNCIFCSICAKKCPTGAICVNRGEKRWSLKRLDCVQCSHCVEVCPKKCLAMTPKRPAVERGVSEEVHYARAVTDERNN